MTEHTIDSGATQIAKSGARCAPYAGFYQKERDKALAVQQRLAAIDAELAAAYARWEALDGQA